MLISVMRISGLLPLIALLNEIRESQRDTYTVCDECIEPSAKNDIEDALELLNIYITDASILFDLFDTSQLIELMGMMDRILDGNSPEYTYKVRRSLKLNLIVITKVLKNDRTINKDLHELLNTSGTPVRRRIPGSFNPL